MQFMGEHCSGEDVIVSACPVIEQKQGTIEWNNFMGGSLLK